MTQLMARVDDDLLDQLDELIAAGAFSSRSDAVRQALAEMIDRHRRQRVGAEIVEGYLRRPQTDAEVGWADAATAAMIAEEPW